jgi:hypothetical protein
LGKDKERAMDTIKRVETLREEIGQAIGMARQLHTLEFNLTTLLNRMGRRGAELEEGMADGSVVQLPVDALTAFAEASEEGKPPPRVIVRSGPKTAVECIEEERARQVEEYDADHDDDHSNGELADAAAWLASIDGLYGHDYDGGHTFTPIGPLWAHSLSDKLPRRQELITAGALIAAEIDRLDRLAAKEIAAEIDRLEQAKTAAGEMKRVAELLEMPIASVLAEAEEDHSGNYDAGDTDYDTGNYDAGNSCDAGDVDPSTGNA